MKHMDYIQGSMRTSVYSIMHFFKIIICVEALLTIFGYHA
jgi:hypothetical protein